MLLTTFYIAHKMACYHIATQTSAIYTEYCKLYVYTNRLRRKIILNPNFLFRYMIFYLQFFLCIVFREKKYHNTLYTIRFSNKLHDATLIVQTRIM